MMRRRVSRRAVLAAALLAQCIVAAVGVVEAHWADQAAAEIAVTGRQARVTLTLPTGLVVFADDARTGVSGGGYHAIPAGRLTDGDIRAHRRTSAGSSPRASGCRRAFARPR